MPVRKRALHVLYAILVMAPWPLLAWYLLESQGLFDRATEIPLVFGGLSLVPLIVVHLIVPMSDAVLGVLVCIIWGLTAVLPPFVFARWIKGRFGLLLMLGVLSCISFAQAAVGALMILGKNV